MPKTKKSKLVEKGETELLAKATEEVAQAEDGDTKKDKKKDKAAEKDKKKKKDELETEGRQSEVLDLPKKGKNKKDAPDADETATVESARSDGSDNNAKEKRGSRPSKMAPLPLRRGSERIDEERRSSGALTEPGKFGPCQFEVQEARTAVLLLESPEVQIVLEALNCLQKFCKKSDENKALFIEMEGLEATKKLISHENLVVRRFALKLIAINSPYHPAALKLRDLNVVPEVVEIAASDDDVVIEYATFILSSMAQLYTGRLQTIQSEGIPVLIRQLSHPDPDIQKNSAEALWRLMEEPLNIPLITNQECVEALLKLVESEYPAVQIVALSVLEKIATTPEGVGILDELDGFSPLAQKLGSPEFGDLHRSILRIFSNVAIQKDFRQKVTTYVPIISRILDTSPDTGAQILALKLLGLLSMVPAVATELVDFGMCRKLMDIFANEENEIEMREAAVFCMYNLAQSDFRAKIEFVEAIGPLLTFIHDKKFTTPEGFEYCVMALASVLEDGQNACPAFIEQNGLEIFKDILLDQEGAYSDDGIITVLSCIASIGSRWNLRPQCVESGIIQTILSVTENRKNPQFLCACANAICCLLCNEDARKQFLDSNGYQFLVDLLSHDEFPVVVAAVPLIHVLGSYKDISRQLIAQGMLNVIWKRRDLITKNGPLRTAFERFISSYQPLKYAISGHIDPFEKLDEGFYDVGGISGSEGFLTLGQWTWEDRDPQRQVLYLNWGDHIDDAAALENNPSLKQAGKNCQSVVDNMKGELANLKNKKELVETIGKAVSTRLGGVLDKWRVGAHSESNEVANLQMKHKSVVIPISMLSTGGFRTRAILFKAACDVFGVPCSLERGEYGRMWNVVLLEEKSEKPECFHAEDPETAGNLVFSENMGRYVVDLVYKPGSIFPVNSYEANVYCFG